MKRVLLKISGEAFSGDTSSLDTAAIQQVAEMIQTIHQAGYETAIVLGGGNIYRGSTLIADGLNPADSHNMSMLSTVFNAVSLKNFLEKIGTRAHILDPLGVEFLETYRATLARHYLDTRQIIICTCGTGNPFFTTDTGGVLRAIETGCDAMIKLTKVDGVYDSDPVTNPQAQKIDALSYDEVISQDLKILDQTGVILARDNGLPLYVTQM